MSPPPLDYVLVAVDFDGAATVLDGYAELKAMAERGGGRIAARFYFDIPSPGRPRSSGWLELGPLEVDEPT